MQCRHCQTAKANRPRGLCWKCYYAPDVRKLYPAHARSPHPEPTEAELERIIAEQRANLPPWWDAETRRMLAGAE